MRIELAKPNKAYSKQNSLNKTNLIIFHTLHVNFFSDFPVNFILFTLKHILRMFDNLKIQKFSS